MLLRCKMNNTFVFNKDNIRDEPSKQAREVEDRAQANNAEIITMYKISSESDIAVKHYLGIFRFKEFALSKAQGYPSYVLDSAYKQ